MGHPVQTADRGLCSYPGCKYPRRIEGTRVHDYCSRTCARKASQMPTGGLPPAMVTHPGRATVRMRNTALDDMDVTAFVSVAAIFIVIVAVSLSLMWR